jgi:glutamate/tyrosine decarboxylase-like PLP-dependent enzyme
MNHWKKFRQQEIRDRVFGALSKNVNYLETNVLGVPASHLDERVFNQDRSFIKDAPFMSTMVQNPNHIGCHTQGISESFFAGTQEIEREVLSWCAVDILKANEGQFDGYIASGGTEANIQAMWLYRNYFMKMNGLDREEIAILCSVDSHYSMDKGANLLALKLYKVKVHEEDRTINSLDLKQQIAQAKNSGIKAFIVIANVMTTMFGSVDDVDVYTSALEEADICYRLHIDAAFGGFYYPFSSKDENLSFKNSKISSFTLDAHKMAQAPYGTGIFLVRKQLIHYTTTESASYVEGEDCTLIGSRSGANAIAIWMILAKNGPFGWFEKIFILQRRTDWMSAQLDELGVAYYRHPFSNIITMKSQCIRSEIAKEFGLVPDNHHQPAWYKIVVMDHVTIEKLSGLLIALKR